MLPKLSGKAQAETENHRLDGAHMRTYMHTLNCLLDTSSKCLFLALPNLLPMFFSSSSLLAAFNSFILCFSASMNWLTGQVGGRRWSYLYPAPSLATWQLPHYLSLLAILLSWASDNSPSSVFGFFFFFPVLIRKMLVSTAFIHCTGKHWISVLLINFVSFHFSISHQTGAVFFSFCHWAQPSKMHVFVFLDRSWIAMGSMQLPRWPFCLYFYIFFILSQMENFSCRVSCFQHSEIEQL